MVNRLVINPSGMKLSRPGIDVLGATLPNDFLFNSDCMVLNLLMSGTAYIDSSFGNVTIPFPFTTSVIPFFSAIVSSSETVGWEHIGRARSNSGLAICQSTVSRSSLHIQALTDRPDYPALFIRYSLWLT